MKSIVRYALLFLCFIFVLLTIMDINSIDTRKSELQETSEISMRNVLKANNINKMYPMNEKDMQVELIRNIAENVNTDSDIDVNILDLNKTGLIDLSLSADFAHLNGVNDSRTIRKTMITEEYAKDFPYQEYKYDSETRKMLMNNEVKITNENAFRFDESKGKILGYDSNKDTNGSNRGLLIIPKTIDGVTVRCIGDSAFNGYQDGKKIVMPSTVEELGIDSFANSNTGDMILPPDIKIINGGAFSNIQMHNLKFTSSFPPTFTNNDNVFVSLTYLYISVPSSEFTNYKTAISSVASGRITISAY